MEFDKAYNPVTVTLTLQKPEGFRDKASRVKM
jgi:hypothetical protein